MTPAESLHESGGPSRVLSVVIPAFNAARFVGDAIESVLAQRDVPAGTALEIIVVDNGSTDGTAEVVRQAWGARVRVVPAPEPRGIAAARNAGLAAATGNMIALLDADDVWLPEKLARQIDVLDREPGVSLVFTYGVEFADPPGIAPVREAASAFLGPSALLGRRAAFDAAGPFPPFRSGEFIAWYGWAQALGLVARVRPEVLVRRRVHAANTTRDRAALADYALAMRWQLERRRALQAGQDIPRD